MTSFGEYSAEEQQQVVFTKICRPGSRVYLAGDFNGWSSTEYPMVDERGDGVFKCTVSLSNGVYQYKYVVDGVWCLDENCPDCVISPLGTYNNVIVVS